jgi:hypothetical protein
MKGVTAHNKRPSFPPGTPPEFAQLAGRCWLRVPADRPALSQIIMALRQMRAQQRTLLAKTLAAVPAAPPAPPAAAAAAAAAPDA